MPKRIQIDPNQFPSDKNVYDLVMAGKVSARKIQELLRRKGLVICNRDLSIVAHQLCSIILDSEELDALLENANIRENRIKTSTIEVSGKNLKIDDIYEALRNTEVSTDISDERVRIVGGLSTPDFDRDTGRISLDQNFKKCDFSKTTLLQEEDHNFSVFLEADASGAYKMTYSTSHPSSEIFFEQIKDGIRKAIRQTSRSDLYFGEIIFSEIPREHVNSFFQAIISDRKIGLTLSHVSKLSLTMEALSDPPEEILEDEAETSEVQDDGEEPLSILRNMRLEGSNLLSHEAVKDHVGKGYVIKSLTAEFYTSESSTSRVYHDIQIGFAGAQRFVSELLKTRVSISGEKHMEVRHLSKAEREVILNQINDVARDRYEEIRNIKREP